MKFQAVRGQLDEVYRRSIATGFAVKQHYFSVVNRTSIGELKGAGISLKDVAYEDVYVELESNDAYHLKLPDGGLMLFQYQFDLNESISKHRLAYFPCPSLPSPEEAPDLYTRDDLYGDIILSRLVRFPIRFDFDPANYRPSYHANSHLTLGQFDNCRIPASHPLSPHAFLVFIARNFYFNIFRKHQNVFEKRMPSCNGEECITDAERRLTRLVIGN